MKVRVDSGSDKRYLHVLTHENTTTASWGFVQPILVNERCPKDNIKIRVGQDVCLSPMSKPTFGRMTLRTYNSFVPIHDIWHPFDSFLAGQSYRGSDSNYVPTQVPEVTLACLTACLFGQSKIEIFECNFDVTGGSEIVGYHNLIVVPSAQQNAVKAAFCADLAQQSPVDLASVLWGNVIGHGDFYYPQTLPVDEYIESDYVSYFKDSNTSKEYVAFITLSEHSRNIRKVLIGCGYQPNMVLQTVSLLPLFAYFKAYFDLFNPPRSRTWKETYAFGFMERIEQHNQADMSIWVADNTTLDLFLNAFMALGDCYYTQNPDYVSAHIVGTAENIATQGGNQWTVPTGYYSGSERTGAVSVVNSGVQPQFNPLASEGYITQNRLDILRKLYYRINSATAIGGRIKAFMKSIYGATEFEEPESNFIGSQKLPVQVSLVESNATTSDGYLGEYAAKGLADGSGKEFKFKCNCHGYVISMIAMVPDARYAQAVDPNLRHLSKYDFFDEKFDSITLLPTPKYCVYGCTEVFGNDVDLNLHNGFGNIPNYMEYKTKYNILNGDLSIASKRSGYLPFTLDKLLPFREYEHYSNRNILRNLPSSLITAGDMWRYIGKDKWLGFFDRIFINSGIGDTYDSRNPERYDLDDNFIVWNYIDYTVQSAALPVADSWQTGVDGGSMEIEKA